MALKPEEQTSLGGRTVRRKAQEWRRRCPIRTWLKCVDASKTWTHRSLSRTAGDTAQMATCALAPSPQNAAMAVMQGLIYDACSRTNRCRAPIWG